MLNQPYMYQQDNSSNSYQTRPSISSRSYKTAIEQRMNKIRSIHQVLVTKP
ncbi:hypothetical protein SAMD00019534_016430 [Acytostelium subglobosum LB1]|uniref:hypothetical protein n=1 Tax=Acytostelium subglobosum LB1 TaxID=1410327 RepID=UPI0006450B2C|nr:hypothetical protein SAMD00019534_016430 [Acytostelium subglobosum LB1]GAM18468.1 hypothetical protein SAMD00019534_016430 [Acytostelium subglobosum LB1]|eukprot:XP_012757688.1 hypothetical protein SAMD00019534_016430 [Acytostelium subglobosum LB1]